MAFWDLFKRNRKPAPVDIEERKGLGLIFNNLTSYGSSAAMKLSAVYCATNQISNSVAMLPLDIIKWDNGVKRKVRGNLWDILNLKPDQNHTHFQFLQ